MTWHQKQQGRGGCNAGRAGGRGMGRSRCRPRQYCRGPHHDLLHDRLVWDVAAAVGVIHVVEREQAVIVQLPSIGFAQGVGRHVCARAVPNGVPTRKQVHRAGAAACSVPRCSRTRVPLVKAYLHAKGLCKLAEVLKVDLAGPSEGWCQGMCGATQTAYAVRPRRCQATR